MPFYDSNTHSIVYWELNAVKVPTDHERAALNIMLNQCRTLYLHFFLMNISIRKVHIYSDTFLLLSTPVVINPWRSTSLKYNHNHNHLIILQKWLILRFCQEMKPVWKFSRNRFRSSLIQLAILVSFNHDVIFVVCDEVEFCKVWGIPFSKSKHHHAPISGRVLCRLYCDILLISLA